MRNWAINLMENDQKSNHFINLRAMVRSSLIFLLLFCSFSGFAQVEITLGPDEIALNQTFTITITVNNDRLRSYEGFPDIKGFNKLSTSSSSSTNIINGRVSSSQSITQNYAAREEGTYTLDPFEMTVNGEKINSPGKTIKVGPPRQANNNPFGFRDPFEEFFGNSTPQEFIEVKDDAFLALTTDKNEVYVGEGVVATLALYVANTNRADLEFYDLSAQLQDIIKEIKPQSCWEENFSIDRIQAVPITINGKRYNQYKIFQSAFYPLNATDIEFPQIGLEMVKYKVAKQRSFFGQDRQRDFKTYYTKPKTIKVKELPPHPLRDIVAVGEYQLVEALEPSSLKTSESFSYRFRVSGEGNISSIGEPLLPESNDLEIYSPNINQQISRSGNKVTGSKTFEYYAIPNEPGTYDMGEYFSWIYFNTKSQQYDTLRSTAALQVTGQSRKNEAILSSDLSGIYDRITYQDNELRSYRTGRLQRVMVNTFLGLLFAGGVVFMIRRYG